MTDTEHEGPRAAENESGSGQSAPPEEISDLLIACGEFVHRATGIGLDLTPETLPVVDHYLSLSREQVSGRPELVPLIVRAVGAYFGEVTRQKIGGFWLLPSPNVFDWLICAKHVFLSFSPIGVAYDALYGGTEHEGPASRLRLAPHEREPVERRLADLPPVSEEEFYLLSTRLEAIEIAADALRSALMAAGYEDTEFEPSDYLQEMRPLGEA